MRYAPVIDANINRAAEGLRVIEESMRFIFHHKSLTDQLAALRKQINASETEKNAHLLARNTHQDMRAKEPPATRNTLIQLLTANFKRVEEALRVLEEYTGNALYNRLRYDSYDLEKKVLLLAQKPIIKNGIYVISDDPDALKKSIRSGAVLVQLRDKTAHKETLLNKANDIIPFAKKHHIPLIINDHVDIALLSNADGLHTGQDDLPIHHLRALLGDHKLIGRTTHTMAQGKKAQKEGADYISVGPIWETPSKPGRKGIGFHYLEKAKSLQIPYVAIGGIDTIEKLKQVQAYTPPLIGTVRAADTILTSHFRFHESKPDNV